MLKTCRELRDVHLTDNTNLVNQSKVTLKLVLFHFWWNTFLEPNPQKLWTFVLKSSKRW